jgi:hypothetical protein
MTSFSDALISQAAGVEQHAFPKTTAYRDRISLAPRPQVPITPCFCPPAGVFCRRRAVLSRRYEVIDNNHHLTKAYGRVPWRKARTTRARVRAKSATSTSGGIGSALSMGASDLLCWEEHPLAASGGQQPVLDHSCCGARRRPAGLVGPRGVGDTTGDATRRPIAGLTAYFAQSVPR